jgi:hypothetical protein
MQKDIPLSVLEELVQEGAYFDKGSALAIIIANKLWSGADLNSYCLERFGFSEARARQFMAAFKVIDNLKSEPTTATLLPASESICRPLTRLNQERQIQAWQFALLTEPDGRLTQEHMQIICEQFAGEGPIKLLTRADVPDAKWPSDNEFEIPLLNLHWQANAVDMPFVLWGSQSRRTAQPGTYHFYTDDYRFDSLWEDPTPLVNSRCTAAVECNFSVYENTPRILALYRIYLKRWLARFWQSQGVRIFVDLNVAREFRFDNLLGVPTGWRSYATRGYEDRPNDTMNEFELACDRAGTTDILFVVYGGGAKLRSMATHHGWIWFGDHRTAVIRNG